MYFAFRQAPLFSLFLPFFIFILDSDQEFIRLNKLKKKKIFLVFFHGLPLPTTTIYLTIPTLFTYTFWEFGVFLFANLTKGLCAIDRL